MICHRFKNFVRLVLSIFGEIFLCICAMKLAEGIENHAYSNRQKQPSRGVLRERCSKNMQQIYRRTPMQSNFIEITLQHGCSPVNLLHIFGTRFPKNTSGRLLLIQDDDVDELLQGMCVKPYFQLLPLMEISTLRFSGTSRAGFKLAEKLSSNPPE